MKRELEEAYRGAIYRVHAPAGSIDVRVGERAAAVDALAGGRPWAFITAWNPGSVPRDEPANRVAQSALEAELAGYALVPAEGLAPGGAWREPGVLVIGVEAAAAAAVARRFGQVAIVAGGLGEPAALVDCGLTGA